MTISQHETTRPRAGVARDPSRASDEETQGAPKTLPSVERAAAKRVEVSTTRDQAVAAKSYAYGALVYTSSGAADHTKNYFIDRGYRRAIPDQETLLDILAQPGHAQTEISQADMDAIVVGQPFPFSRSFVQSISTGALYVLLRDGASSNRLQPIPDKTTYQALGYLASQTIQLEQSDIDRFAHAPALTPVTADPWVSTSQVSKWMDDSLGRWSEGNAVDLLIDGDATLREIRKVIDTATWGSKFFMADWYVDIYTHMPPPGFPVTDDGKCLFECLDTAVKHNGCVVRALFDSLDRPISFPVLRPNAAATNWINAYGGSNKAVQDNRVISFGSHHQKLFIASDSGKLTAFVGGIDFSNDRLEHGSRGTPIHDLQCKVQGPAARDLYTIIRERWLDHEGVDLGDLQSGAAPSSCLRLSRVQVGRTYPNPVVHNGLKGSLLEKATYSFAPTGEQTARAMLLRAINAARSYIYMEDQYFWSEEVVDALIAALPRLANGVVIVVRNPDVSGGPDVIADVQVLAKSATYDLMKKLKNAGGSKVSLMYLPKNEAHSYVHSKVWIFDDEYALIGSMNSNRRSLTHDSEVVVGVCDTAASNPHASSAVGLNFARRLRMGLWSEHLGRDPSTLREISSCFGLWGTTGRAVAYNVADLNPPRSNWRDRFWWKTVTDPEGGPAGATPALESLPRAGASGPNYGARFIQSAADGERLAVIKVWWMTDRLTGIQLGYCPRGEELVYDGPHGNVRWDSLIGTTKNATSRFMTLDLGDSIASIDGYTEIMYSNGDGAVRSLRITTRDSGGYSKVTTTFGAPTGDQPFRYEIPSNVEISGFWGATGQDYIGQIGVLWRNDRLLLPLNATPMTWGPAGEYQSTARWKLSGQPTIGRIRMLQDNDIPAQVWFYDTAGQLLKTVGQPFGNSSTYIEWSLNSHGPIKAISGEFYYCNRTYITYLEITDMQGNKHSCGRAKGDAYHYKFSFTAPTGYYIAGFFGHDSGQHECGVEELGVLLERFQAPADPASDQLVVAFDGIDLENSPF